MMIIILLLLFLLLCSSPGIDPFWNFAPVPAEEAESTEDPVAANVSFHEDYTLLWDTLENSYPYLPYLEQQGLDMNAIRNRYAEKLTTVKDEDAFSGLIHQMFYELYNFAHLNLITPEQYQSLYAIYVLDDQFAGSVYSEPFSRILQDPRLSSRYQPPESLETYQEQVVPKRYPDVNLYYIYEEKALYFQISSFAHALVARDQNLISDTLQQYPETEHIIFDITGNGGGSDYYWIENLVAPFGNCPDFEFRSFFKSSAFMEEYYPRLESFPVSDLKDAPSWAQEMGLDRYIVNHWVFPEEEEGKTYIKNIKRWVLIGPNNYSASDKFACFCKTTGFATLVGTPTSGDGLGSTPLLLLLPESGLLVRFSSMAGENPDQSLNAAVGTLPDVPCVKKMTALNRCLEWIRNRK